MKLTRFGFRGFVFYLAMAGAFLAAPYSNLFFLLLAFLTLQWFLSAVWTLRNLRGATVSRIEIEPGPAGAGQAVRARIAAAGRTRFQLAIELELVGGRRIRGQAPVVDGEAVVAVRVPPLPRGLHEVRGAWLTTAYPLGLVEARRRVDAPDEVVVYPAPSELVEARSGAEALAELLGHGAAGAGELQPSGLRDKRDGDELRAVHWRASARRGTLVVKEWEGGAGQGLEVLIDRRAEAEALEAALGVVSAVVQLARDHKEILTLHSQGLQETFGREHRPWHEALRFLAGAEALPRGGPAPPSVSPSVTRLPLVAHAG